MRPALETRALCKSFGALTRRERDRFPARARRAPRADRPERRRQDQLRQSGDRGAARRSPGTSCSTAPTVTDLAQVGAGQARPCPHLSDHRAVPPPQRPRKRDAGDRRARGRRRRSGAARRAPPARHRRGLRAARNRSASPTTRCARSTRSPMAASGWSRSPWRSASRRRCCCSTSRPPACRRARPGMIIEVVERLPTDIARLDHRARHGSGVPPGAPHHRDGRRARSSSKARREAIAADPRGAPGLSRRAGAGDERRLPERGLRLVGVAAGYGETVVLEGVSLDLAAGRHARGLGRNGVGKTTLLGDDHRAIPRCMPATSILPAEYLDACRPIAGRGSASVSCRRSARSFRR